MFWALVTTLVAGIAAAGGVMVIRMTLRGRVELPGWLTPIAAGAAMIAATIALEYSWYDTTRAALPEGMEITVTRENQAWFRPWTWVAPFTEGFIAVDTFSAQTNPNLPDARLVTLYVYGRNMPVGQIPVVFDCKAARRADIVDGTPLPAPEDWLEVAPDDPTLLAACAGD